MPNVCLFEIIASGVFAGGRFTKSHEYDKSDVYSRQAHSGKAETTILSERNSCESKVSILSREMIEG